MACTLLFRSFGYKHPDKNTTAAKMIAHFSLPIQHFLLQLYSLTGPLKTTTNTIIPDMSIHMYANDEIAIFKKRFWHLKRLK